MLSTTVFQPALLCFSPIAVSRSWQPAHTVATVFFPGPSGNWSWAWEIAARHSRTGTTRRAIICCPTILPYGRNFRASDALLATNRVEQVLLAAVFKNRRIAQRPLPSLRLTGLGWRCRQIDTFVRLARRQDFHGRGCSPVFPIAIQINRGEHDSLGCISNGGKKDIQPVAADLKRHMTDSLGVRSMIKRVRARLEDTQRIF